MKLSRLQNPEDLSFICSLLQSSLHQMNDSSNNNNNRNKKKRQREDENDDDDGDSSEIIADKGNKKKNIKGILTSLLLVEEQDKREQDEVNRSAKEEKLLFESNGKKKFKAMVEYYGDQQDYYTEVEELERTKRKKSRAAAAAVAVAAASSDGLDNKTLKRGSEIGGGGGGTTGQHRRLWVKERSNAWWDECNNPDFPEEEFKKAFRMGRATFDMICEELNSVIAKEDTTLRNAIPVRQRVAVCLWRLATGDPLRLVSKRFGLGISTCHKLVLEVCSAIRNVLMPKYLQWPSDENALRKVKEEFQANSEIPNVVGSMYTTHIPIIAPKVSVAAYFNRKHTERNQKTSYSITVQGVVDPRGVFTDVCIGWPGSMPDDQVLEKSALYQRANNGLLKDVWIVGSSGYPLMDWVMVPYTQPNLTWPQSAFNEKIGEIQRISKDAFARLKGRWSCLQKRTEVKLQDLPVVLGACCVLHNICELKKEEMDPELKFDLVDDDMVPEMPLRSASSMKARDAIAHHILHHGTGGIRFV